MREGWKKKFTFCAYLGGKMTSSFLNFISALGAYYAEYSNHILLSSKAPGASIISSALNQLQSATFIAIRFLRYTIFGVIHSKKPNLFYFFCKITEASFCPTRDFLWFLCLQIITCNEPNQDKPLKISNFIIITC